MTTGVEKMETRLDLVISDLKKDLQDRYITKDEAISAFVPWDKFTWIVGILISMMTGMFGFVSWQIRDSKSELGNNMRQVESKVERTDDKVTNIRENVATINGLLNSAEITR